MVMLACARIGAVHSVVFAGFSAEALRARIIHAKSKWGEAQGLGRRASAGALFERGALERGYFGAFKRGFIVFF